jgi:hypothetical protein
MTAPKSQRRRFARRLSWLVAASMMATAIFAPATFAGDKTEITICHGTGSQSNPYVTESPAINSSGAFAGELAGGHNGHVGPLWFPGITVEWGDIIPPYDYAPANFHFDGLNWTAAGQAIYNNGCNIPEPTATPTAAPTATPTAAPTATPVPEPTATPVPEPTATPVPEATATPVPDATATPVPQATATPAPPTGGVGGITGTPKPRTTLPPTDTLTGTSPSAPPSQGWRLILLAMAGLLGAALVLTPAQAPARSDRRR